MAKQQKKSPVSAAVIWALLRLTMGFTFLWAFVDKTFGLGFSTCRADSGAVNVMCDAAWLSGGSPTRGFLTFGTSGPFAEFYQGMAGSTMIDWLFMVGLLGIGLALLLGIGMKIAVISGVLLLMMMYTAALPPKTNPVLDSHVLESLVLIGLYVTNRDQVLGLGKRWRQTGLVKRLPFLE